MLTLSNVRRLIVSLANNGLGNQVATILNQAKALWEGTSHSLPALIVATAVSATTNFGALRVGDRVVRISPTAGNAQAFTVVTAGTLPAAAVVGDFYLVYRAKPTVEASAVKL